MSLIKKLWYEEGLYPTEDYDFHDVDEYDYNYDFYDVDDDKPVEGDDDGKFNFGDIDLGDETAEGDWDMNEDHPVEPEPGSENYDFYDIDTDPPVTGDDDGVYNFGDLNANTSPTDYDFENPEGDDDEIFDFRDIDTDVPDLDITDWDFDLEGLPRDENGESLSPQGDPGTAEGDYDMGEAEEDEEFIYDFYDIEEHPDLKHTQYDIEYDFGDTDNIGWQKTKNFMIMALNNALQEILNKEVKLLEVDLDQEAAPYVDLQYYYNERTNKSFMQFEIYNYTGIINHNRFMDLVTWKINSQFKYDTGITGEVVNSRDQDLVPNNRMSVTPYTIGFWQSINGHYEAIEDRVEVELDLKDTNTPPNKTFTIWNLCQVAESINRRYNTIETNTIMSPEDKEEYMTRYMAILTQYHDPIYKDIYREKVNELNEEFNARYHNENIPDAVREFVAYYKDYFQCNIPDIYTYTRRCKMKLANL